MRRRVLLALLPTVVIIAVANVAAVAQPVAKALVHHAVSTSVSAAQEAFDEGLTLVYAFNREEARKRFELAASLDPTLAMAQWGIALAVGPNVNIDMSADDLKIAAAALGRAKSLAAKASPEERAYIDALAVRYPSNAEADTAPAYRAYRDAMAALHATFPAEPDAATLYGESIMDVDADWGYSRDPSAAARALFATLHAALAIAPNHVGANHYLIHALDSPEFARDAVPSARLLAALPVEPAASHLVHMSGHTFLDVGDFVALEAANAIAVRDDDAYAASVGKKPFDLDYYGHNLDFYGGSALMLDDRAVADDVASRFAAARNARALLIYARERRWDAIDAFAPPPLVPGRINGVAVYRYARTLSAIARGNLAAAATERDAYATILAAQPAAARPFYAPFLQLLDARIAHARGDDVTAVATLRAFESATADAPPEAFAPWYFPAGEWLGTILLREGDLDGAERAFRASLERTPNDARVLFGLSETLGREGRLEEARALAPQIVAHWRGPAADLRATEI